VSFFKRLFGRQEPVPPEPEPPVEPALDHFAIITTPAPPSTDEQPAEEEPPVAEPPRADEEPAEPERAPEEPVTEEPLVAEPQPTVESPAVAVVEIEAPPEPAGEEITVGRLTEDEVRGVLEQALDELGSAHHRPFSRG
jgi:hypothetical protein